MTLEEQEARLAMLSALPMTVVAIFFIIVCALFAWSQIVAYEREKAKFREQIERDKEDERIRDEQTERFRVHARAAEARAREARAREYDLWGDEEE